MLFGILILAIIGIYVFWRTSRGKEVSKETREFEARVKRSIAGANNPIPGVDLFRGQSSNDFMVGPLRDEIGPDEGHIFSMTPAEPEDPAAPTHPVDALNASGATRRPASRGASTAKKPSSPGQRKTRPRKAQPLSEQSSVQVEADGQEPPASPRPDR